MTCRLWIWDFQGTKTAFGHASLSIYDGEPGGTYYVSWWPDCSPGGDDSSWEGKRQEYFGLCEPHRSRKFSQDVSAEFGKYPDRHISLGGLNETVMKSFWDELTHDVRAKWSASATNCAAAVAAALKAGGSDQYFGFWRELEFDIFDTNWVSWTPNSVFDYARRLSGYLRDAGKMP